MTKSSDAPRTINLNAIKDNKNGSYTITVPTHEVIRSIFSRLREAARRAWFHVTIYQDFDNGWVDWSYHMASLQIHLDATSQGVLVAHVVESGVVLLDMPLVDDEDLDKLTTMALQRLCYAGLCLSGL